MYKGIRVYLTFAQFIIKLLQRATNFFKIYKVKAGSVFQINKAPYKKRTLECDSYGHSAGNALIQIHKLIYLFINDFTAWF